MSIVKKEKYNMKAIINARVYDYQKYIENGYIVFDTHIRDIGEMKNFKNNGYQIIDAKGKLLLPTFVCAHAHIYSVFAGDVIAKLGPSYHPNNFQEILDQLWWKLDSKIDNEITYYSGIASGHEFLLNGVTTIIDHHASGIDIRGSLSSLKKALTNTAKLRSILCFETSDRYNIKDCINENVSFYKKNQTEFCTGLFGMHASMSLSDKSLKMISKKIENMPIHIHVAESKMDEEQSYEKYGKDIISRLVDNNLLNKDSLIVHGVHISENELKQIYNAGAYMVVNLTSNMNNGVGLPDIATYKKNNLKVLVGNDGISCSMANEFSNAYYTTKLKNEDPNAGSLDDVKDMITDSYEYVSRRLNIKLGKFSSGYVSDFMLVEFSPYRTMNSNNAFSQILFGLFSSFKPSDVFVNGNRLVKNYQTTSKKLNEEYKKCPGFAKKLCERIGK